MEQNYINNNLEYFERDDEYEDGDPLTQKTIFEHTCPGCNQDFEIFKQVIQWDKDRCFLKIKPEESPFEHAVLRIKLDL